MVSKQPMIPRSRLDGGVESIPHPATIPSHSSPDAQNVIAEHGAAHRRHGIKCLNLTPAMGSGLKQKAVSWSGESVDNWQRPMPRRSWLGSGLIPYSPVYTWENGLIARFRLKVGNQETRYFNEVAPGAGEYYRRFILGTGYDYIPGQEEVNLRPDWAIFIADGGDNRATDNGAAGTGVAGNSYLCACYYGVAAADVISYGVISRPLLEGDVIDVEAHWNNNATDVRLVLKYRLAGTATWYTRDETDLAVGPLEVSQRCISVFGPYEPGMAWSTAARTDYAGPATWYYLRFIPAEGVLENLYLGSREGVPAGWEWPTHTRLTDEDIAALSPSTSPRLWGYWPGYGVRDYQFLDVSPMANHGYFTPPPPTLFEEDDRLPGVLLDCISSHVVRDFSAPEEGAENPSQTYESTMLRQFICSETGAARRPIFKDADGNDVVISLTLGTTVTLFENRRVDLVKALRVRYDADAPASFAGNAIMMIEAFYGAAHRLRVTAYGVGPAGGDITVEGPTPPIGRPFTVTATQRTVRTATQYETIVSLYVDGTLVDSDAGIYAPVQEKAFGPLVEILGGPFHGFVHDIRLGVHDYEGFNERVCGVAVPDTPPVLNWGDVNPGTTQQDFRDGPLTYHRPTNTSLPCFYDAGGSVRGLAIHPRLCRSEPNRRPWVTGHRDIINTTSVRTGTMYYPDGRYNHGGWNIGKHDTIWECACNELHFSWIFAWWRAWPTRAGDVLSRNAKPPSRCWRKRFHPGAVDSRSVSGTSSGIMPDTMFSFLDMDWVAAYREDPALHDAETLQNPVFHQQLSGGDRSPIDLGLKWGESSMMPVSADGSVAFVHQWRDGEGTEVFLGSGRNLYIYAPPWSKKGTRLRFDGASYWLQDDTTNQEFLNPYDGITAYTIHIGFWYRRGVARNGYRTIVCAHADDDNHPWTVYEQDGRLYIGAYQTAVPVIFSGSPAVDPLEDVFADRLAHWCVVKVEGGAVNFALQAFVDGAEIELENPTPACNAFAGTMRLRIGGGCEQEDAGGDYMVPAAQADIDCEIWGMHISTTVGGALHIPVIPPQAIPVIGSSKYVIDFTEAEGYSATDTGYAPAPATIEALTWVGRDLFLLDDNLSHISSGRAEVLQANLDAALVSESGLPRRWRRGRDTFGSNEWFVDYLGLPDPWETFDVEDCDFDTLPPDPDVVGELVTDGTYAVAIRFYDMERDIYTLPVYAETTVTVAADHGIGLSRLPRNYYGRATHTQVLLSLGSSGVWVAARMVIGTDNKGLEVVLIEDYTPVDLDSWGEPPRGKHLGVLLDQLFIGNLPLASAQAMAVSTQGYIWCFPPLNYIRVGDSQDGVIMALHAGMGRIMIVQEGVCSWFTPGPTLLTSNLDQVVRSIGFICRWGPVTWTGPLIGMTTRGPATTDGLQFQFMGDRVKDMFQAGTFWTVAYDGQNQHWWFFADSEGDWCNCMVLSKGAEPETWSPVKLPNVTAIGEMIVDQIVKMVVGTRHGRIGLLDGDGECIDPAWPDIPATGIRDIVIGTKLPGLHYPTPAGDVYKRPEMLRGLPLYTESGEPSIILGPQVEDNVLGGIWVRGENGYLVDGATYKPGAVDAWWTSPWMDFGRSTRRKEIAQFWLTYAAIADELYIDFASASETDAVSEPMTRDFPTTFVTKTVNMTNGVMVDPVQLYDLGAYAANFFRFRIRTLSNKPPWEVWKYVIEGEEAGGRAE